ncbi:hypothetical protein SUGI_0785620 [Cryptomeria japonica]|nr:hypothetical protein SUGI_0785620 [Cryptomeria japonica]
MELQESTYRSEKRKGLVDLRGAEADLKGAIYSSFAVCHLTPAKQEWAEADLKESEAEIDGRETLHRHYFSLNKICGRCTV